MTSARIQLAFEGEEVGSGTIDAHALATSLMAFSDAFHRANEIANGEDSQASVRISADFEHSSFDVNIVLTQDWIEQAKALLTGFKETNAFDLIMLLVLSQPDSLISLCRWLKGKMPDKAKLLGDGWHLEFNGQKKVVNQITYKYYGDAALRSAMAQLVEPLHRPGIERMKFQAQGIEAQYIEKADADYFVTDSLELVSEDTPKEGDREAVLTIVKLSFKEGVRWSFLEGGAALNAMIEDTTFLDKMHKRKYKFADGDSLRVKLHWKVVKSGNRLYADNTITKVIKVITTARQLSLEEAGEAM